MFYISERYEDTKGPPKSYSLHALPFLTPPPLPTQFDEQQMRGKVEATLLRNQVMDYIASKAILDVKYEEEAEFDEDLMNDIMEKQAEAERERVAKVAQAAADEEAKL